MTEEEFILADRIQKIKSVNEQYNLYENSWISFSGGKDSSVVNYLIDLALPNNKIPRVYINTGIDYKKTVRFVEKLQEKDHRIIIMRPIENVKDTLNNYGYPFKSKEHSRKIKDFNRGLSNQSLLRYSWKIKDEDYERQRRFACPKKLMYQFEEKDKYNYSDECCIRLKERLFRIAEKKFGKEIAITGMRKKEGGRRNRINCMNPTATKFSPLAPVTDEWESWFIKEMKVELNPLYNEPFNFDRTGCIGCPFAINIDHELRTLKKYDMAEFKRAWNIFGYVYKEYRRIDYRLTKESEIDDEL